MTFNGKGLIAIAGHKHHLGIYPLSPKVVKALKTNLKEAEFSEGTIRFSYDRLPTEKEILMIVKMRRDEIL